MHERRFDASRAHRLDMPERRKWLPVEEVIQALGLRSGDIVADVGAGTGYFSLPLAEVVGVHGRVYAVDAQAEMLAHIEEKLKSCRERNIQLIHAEADATPLSAGTCDLVFLANVWHEFADRDAVLRETKRILSRIGRVAILDWSPDAEPEHGPPLEHRLSSSSAVAELLPAGFNQATQQSIGRYSWLVQAFAGEEG